MKKMWAHYRKWKHGIAPFVLGFSYFTMRVAAEGSALWYTGLVSAIVMGSAYVIEEIVWNLRGEARPCPACGHRIRMKSFSFHNNCSSCGEKL